MKTYIYILLTLISFSISHAQVGIGTTNPDDNSLLEVESTNRGMGFPQLTTTNRDNINNPAKGLTIYNTTEDCLQTNLGTPTAPVWECLETEAQPIGFACRIGTTETVTISTTPCSDVSGATLNDDTSTAEGTEYDWTNATTSGMATNTSTRALVDINGQCWMRYNMEATVSGGSGHQDYYDAAGSPFPNEGRLYSWSRAMNGSTTERAQGVCPSGWHVPSDCEWKYLEASLGMSPIQQDGSNFRGIDEATKLKSGGSSGFNALLTGRITTGGDSVSRGTIAYFWTSTSSNVDQKTHRLLGSGAKINRVNFNSTSGHSVRCLKD